MITPLPFGGGEGGGANCLLVCEVTPTGLLVWGVESFFSHRAHRVHGGFWRTVSSPQNASGIQRTQSVSAIVDTEQGVTGSLHPRHRGISVITPLPFGGGDGGGANISKNTNHANRKCQDISQTVPFYNRERAELEA